MHSVEISEIYSPQCSQNFQNRNLRVKNYFLNFGILTIWPSKWVHGPLEIYSFEHMNPFNHSKNLGQRDLLFGSVEPTVEISGTYN